MNNKTEKKKRKFLSDEEKMDIIKLHHLEGVSQCELARCYDTRQPVVSRIISKFAAENDKSALLMKKHTTDSLSEENKALRKEVMELKKQLYHEKMWADFYDTMVDVAEELFGIEIRKKAVTGQLKCEECPVDIR